VAVAVAQHEVTLAHHSVPHDLVRRGSAADHEQRFVGTEYARGIALAGSDGAGVVEQRSKLPHRDRNVGTQGVLAEELVEELTHGTLAERNTAAVAGRMPGVAGVQCVIHQSLEHGRRQAPEIQFCRARDGAGQKLGRVLEQAHKGVRVLQHARRYHLRGALVAEKEDRQAIVAATLGGEHFLQDLPLIRAGLCAVHGNEPARLIIGDVDETARVLVTEAAHHAKSFLLDRRRKLTHAAAGGALAFVVLVDNGDGECLEKFHGLHLPWKLMPSEEGFLELDRLHRINRNERS
jgi:hypothetical protein